MNQHTAPLQAVTAVILAGGRARRMGGQDKGLIKVGGRPMIEHVLERVTPQVGAVLLNVNRNWQDYGRYGLPLVADRMGDYFGPLVGMASALEATDSELLLTVPCDSPIIPPDLARRLLQTLTEQDAEISVVHDGQRMQPVFALLQRRLLPSLVQYLNAGGRKIDTWYAQHRTVVADFSDRPELFLNVNTPDEQTLLEAELRRLGQQPQS